MVLLSAGQALAQTAPAQNEAPSQVDEVVVTGFRASLANALSLKKNSDQIIESITAEDMGKFPDQNIAESLQRLPGVQIDRENGQGTKVRIRGLDQNVTLLNSDTFLSGLEAFRLGEGNAKQTNSLEGIPSNLLAGVDVIKSPQADQIEGALGGTVNLKTRNALDMKNDLTLALDVAGNQGSTDGKLKPNLSAVIGYKISDTFGLLGSFTYDENWIDTEVLSGENRGGWAFLNRPTATGNNQVQTGTTNIWSPEYRYSNNRHQERERTAFSLNADWDVSDTLSLRADWFHSDLEDLHGRALAEVGLRQRKRDVQFAGPDQEQQQRAAVGHGHRQLVRRRHLRQERRGQDRQRAALGRLEGDRPLERQVPRRLVEDRLRVDLGPGRHPLYAVHGA